MKRFFFIFLSFWKPFNFHLDAKRIPPPRNKLSRQTFNTTQHNPHQEQGKYTFRNNEKNINFGSVYENATAQELRAHGFKDIYFFNSRKQGELDFLIPMEDEVVPIEIKSGKDYTTHAALAKVLNNPDYGIRQAYVFSNANVKVEGIITYMPIYRLMFLKKDEIPGTLVYNPDIDILKE